MALEGTLDDFSLADIFQLIGIQRKSGILTLKSNDETVTVTFFNGMVVGADSTPKKLEDRLGKVLVKTGLITQDQLELALEKQKRTLQKIGFILVDQNYISREELKEALQIQVTQMVYRLFRWNSGEYYFDQKARLEPESEGSIPPMSAESLLMEGIHMIDEWPAIEKRIPTFDLVYRPMVPGHEIVLAELESDNGTGAYGADVVLLSREEESVYRLIDGKTRVADIIESSKLGEFHTCKALCELLERKIIEPVAMAPLRTIAVNAAADAVARQSRIRSYSFLYPVIAIAALAALYFTYRDPLRIARYSFFQPHDRNVVTKTVEKHQLEHIDSAIVSYFYSKGVLPRRLQDLVANYYLHANDIVDTSSRPFSYEINGETYTLSSARARQEGPESELVITRTLSLSPERIRPHNRAHLPTNR